MRLTNLDIIDKAAKLIRDKFDIDFTITNSSIETWSAGEAICVDGPVLCVAREPELRIKLTVTKDHDGLTECIDLKYRISGEDLRDGGLVDELIGGDLKKQAPDMRQALRLAFVLYNGIRYGMTGEQKKAYADKGWLPRVISVRKQSYRK